MDENLLDYIRRFIELQDQKGSSYYGSRYTSTDVDFILNPVSDRNVDAINILPYEDRVEIAKIYLEKLIDDEFVRNNFNYNKRKFNIYSWTILDKMLSNSGYECSVDVSDRDDSGKPIKWVRKTENFHQIFLDRLYKQWDTQIEQWNENKQNAIELLFEFQLTGRWFYYNNHSQNFLRIYLEYLKNKGYRINIFEIFRNKIDKLTKDITQGLSHYTRDLLFETLMVIFDFYMAIIDLYGENNTKVINKLQTTLNYIFKEKLNVEKLGFMNTFLYTNYYKPKTNRFENYDEVKYFWEKIYTNNLNPTLKKIFLNALIYTWNKSPIPKVRNSIQLIADLSTYKYKMNYDYHGFPFQNQSIFYTDLISNANGLKKSVKTILFSKAIIEEGGLYLGG